MWLTHIGKVREEEGEDDKCVCVREIVKGEGEGRRGADKCVCVCVNVGEVIERDVH